MCKLRYLFFVYFFSFLSTPLNAAPENCVALKGNGPWVTSHFNALARYVEYAGAPDALSGSSSGAVSSFFYESILMSPLLEDVSEEEKENLIALLLKSLPQSIADAIGLVITDELKILSSDPFYATIAKLLAMETNMSLDSSVVINAVVTDMAILFENKATVESVFVIIDAVDQQGFLPGVSDLFIPEVRRYLINHSAEMKSIALELNELNKAENLEFDEVLAILPDDLLAIYLEKIYTDIFSNKHQLKFLPRLINKEFVDSLVTDKAEWNLNKKQILDVISFFVTLDNDISQLLINPSIINLDVVVELTSALNDFYAYAGNINGKDTIKDKWHELFKLQLENSKAKSWYELPAAWRDEYKISILLPALKTFLTGSVPLQTIRDKDFVGDRLHVAIGNGVLVGDRLVEDFEVLQKSLKTGDLDINEKKAKIEEFVNEHDKLINHFKVGYFTSQADAITIESNISDQKDTKSKRYTNLGRATWRQAIVMSVSEPGLGSIATSASYGYKKSKFVSLAGWADLAPTQVLKAMQCKTTAIITRIGNESKLSTGIYKALGEKVSKISEVHNYLDPESSNSTALSKADIVFCHNTLKYSPLDLRGLAHDSYNPTEIIDQRLNPGSISKYHGCGGSDFL